MIKHIPLFKVFVADDASHKVSEVLRSGYIGQGPKVEEYESALKKHFGTDYVATVNSCTSALQLAVHLIKKDNFSPDDEIITTPLTCFASISSILANNVRVRWADVDPNNCNIDLTDVERKLSPRTRGLLVVHWGGYPVDLDRLRDIQQKYQKVYGRFLPIIEDCAHCWSAKFKNELIGTSGNYCCFSHQAIKFLTTSDGGTLITPDAKTHYRAKLLRWFGLDRDAGASFRCIQDIRESGFKYHLNDVSAAIGLANLPFVEDLVEKHRDNSAFYDEELEGVSGVTLLENRPEIESSCWLFTMKVEERKLFIEHMKSRGIDCSPVHARCDKHSCVQEFRACLPGMDSLENTMCCIPVGWWLTEEDRQYIVNSIKEGW